jgi:ATP-dependent DNA ligase
MRMAESDPLLPQRASQLNADVLSVDWLFEPSWPGERLIVRRSAGGIAITNAAGESVNAELPEVAGVLEHALLAQDAVVDGVWTSQPFIGDGSPARAWAETLAEEGLADEVPDPMETEQRRAFVAIDLIEIDGEPLYDVPLQERRRILESIVEEDVRVRVSPLVKQPISGWLEGWRLNGFTHFLAKHVNSRYRPGTVCEDWLEIPVVQARRPGFAQRMFGSRERRRSITD